MSKAEKNRKIQAVAQKIAKQFKPDKIILFGSYAWGKPHVDSDVDLFIVKETDQSKIERGQEIERILWGSGMPVDALVYTPEETQKRLDIEDFFIQNILTKGKILYSAS